MAYPDDAKNWIRDNMPDLDRELGPMTTMQVLARLNAETGLDIQPSASIPQTMPLFLAKLKEMHGKQ